MGKFAWATLAVAVWAVVGPSVGMAYAGSYSGHPCRHRPGCGVVLAKAYTAPALAPGKPHHAGKAAAHHGQR